MILITAAVFWNVPKGEFVRWDDDIKIYRNEHLGSFSRDNLAWMFTDTQRLLYYAPVSWLLLNSVWHFYRLDPFGYHLASLLLHCTNTLLVFLLIHRILSRALSQPVAQALGPVRKDAAVSQVSQAADPGEIPARDRVLQADDRNLWFIAALAALLWSVHPMRVEAVAWATPISHLLASFFVLLSFLFYLRFRSGPPRTTWYVASLLCFLAAMLSYPVVLAFPAILMISDLYFQRVPNASNHESTRVDLKSLCFGWLPFVLVSIGALAVTLYGRVHAVRFFAAPVSTSDFSLLQRAAQAFYVWAYYLWKPLVPFHLSPVDLNLSEVNPAALRFLFSALFICAISLVLWMKRTRFVGLLALWLSYLVLLVPMLGLTEYPHYTSDRYSYLPALVQVLLAGLVLAIAFRSESWKKSSAAALLLLIGACALVTIRQIAIWHDSRSLFAHILSLIGNTPAAGVIHTRLGFVLADAGEIDAALPEFKNALRLYPGYWEAYAGLGGALGARTNWSGALDAYAKAIAANPNDAQTHFERAAILVQQGRVADAVTGYADGLRLDPNNVEALNNLAWILATTANDKTRDGARAVTLALRACQLTRFESPVLIGTLAAAYAEAGAFNLAVETAQKARDLARATGNQSVAARNQELLALYKSGKPFSE